MNTTQAETYGRQEGEEKSQNTSVRPLPGQLRLGAPDLHSGEEAFSGVDCVQGAGKRTCHGLRGHCKPLMREKGRDTPASFPPQQPFLPQGAIFRPRIGIATYPARPASIAFFPLSPRFGADGQRRFKALLLLPSPSPSARERVCGATEDNASARVRLSSRLCSLQAPSPHLGCPRGAFE